ncbi:P-type phospholipid transporter [Mycena chlorophos]|uniref:Phospholipid-transporting ATPase n=1 Tax=Mycena chlorophos TaxID=658473 RepID=A0A8H6TAV8_MYCCL|nr:P-type phospholipid transporter [Mycena chlorophos]
MSFRKRQRAESTESSEEDENIDPQLRLRTVRTAASAIAESIVADERQTRQRRRFFRSRGEKDKERRMEHGKPLPGGKGRHVYVNTPLPRDELDSSGDPIARYPRNKVRTTKYTILTFIPKNLYEQFRRIANIFFLALVVFQVFPVFGAAAGSVAVLPLAFILVVTAIRDGIEDYRRGRTDDQVNNSPTTRLPLKNPNQPRDGRTFFQKLFGTNKPGTVSRGVKKLRAAEAASAPYGSQSTLNTAHSYPPPPVLDPNIHPSAAQWERTLWKKLDVGDLVLLKDNDQVPADIIVLATSDPDGNCYLETKNLDGETNLKLRKALTATRGMSCNEEEVQRARFVLQSEPPSQNLYLYNGVLRYRDYSSVNSNFSSVHARAGNAPEPSGNQGPEDRAEPVSINEMLLRGCSLRNTAWVVGLVVFTGADTKIMLNGGDTPSKRSKIERETNFNVAVNFVILLLMCVLVTIFFGLEDARTATSKYYFEGGTDPTTIDALNSLVTLVSCIIAFQNIIPISLYISIEIVKTIQAYFISQDVDMYYEGYDTPCVPKTWNISDDLGQIEYVFSDKTGTLTQNVMEFQKCSVNGVAYGEGVTEAQRGAATRAGITDAMDPEELNAKLAGLKQSMISTMERGWTNPYLRTDKLTMVSPVLANSLANESSPERPHLIQFFRALSLCHTVLSERHGNATFDDDKTSIKLDYKAESPDETALVGAARDVGFAFVNKARELIEISVLGVTERWTLLRVLEFNSTRKRMSCIYRSPEGKIVMFSKGADSVMYARLAADHDEQLKEATRRDMESFANSGLRTLCVGMKVLSQDEYTRWSRSYDEAANRIEGRDEAIEAACDQIERGFTILGATALEDKLQEGVPAAIDLLHRAGIKLWILTGDKLQTAIEIGYSCNLLKPDMDLMILSADSQQQARAQIEAGLNKVASVLGPPSWDPRKRGFVPGAQAAFAVVIDGDTLTHALKPELKEMFLNLGTQCETVVCCRVSPAQKALTVKLVKEGRNAMTLSIGDGANDVAMIQEANIGCGLFGLEGSQAAMSADYAFGQFRYLTKLLLVHGRWSYQRVAEMHANFFYKNVIWTFGLFWYMPYNGHVILRFDSTYLYHYTFILLCSVVFTSLPVIVMGSFDQDINARAALAFPQLYIRGIRGLEYTRLKFWLYMFDGFFQSAVMFFIPYLIWYLGLAVSWNGRGIDSLADFGTTVAVAAIFTANSYVGMNSNYWTVLTWVVVFGSTIVMMLWIVIYSFFLSSDFIDEFIVLFGELTFWTTVVLTSAIALAPRFCIKYYSTVYHPLDKDIVREMWVRGDLKDQLGIAHRNGKSRRIVDHSATSSGHEPETAPMFSSDQHARSFSELSTHRYEPANQSSPGIAEGVPPTVPYSDTTPPNEEQAQYLYAPQPRTGHQPISPDRGSYYSVSELPPPSPMPSPKYKLTTGEVTSTPPSRRTSVATTRAASLRRGASTAKHTPTPLSPRLSSPSSIEQQFEMQPRSPRSPPPSAYSYSRPPASAAGHSMRSQSAASNASFATAQEGYYDDDDNATEYGGHHQQGEEAAGQNHDPQHLHAAGGNPGWRESQASWDGGYAM